MAEFNCCFWISSVNNRIMSNIQNRLICQEFSSPDIESALRDRNIYFGTGFVTPKAITQGVPFDFLGYLLTAEHTRRKAGADKIIHLLADTHAIQSKPVDLHPQIFERIEECISTYRGIVEKLGLQDHYVFVRASDLEQDKDFFKVKNSISTAGLDIPDFAISYVTQQLADMAYMKQHCNVAAKLSWLLDPKAKKAGFDERFFDDLYGRLFPQAPLSYIYTYSGRSLDPQRPRVSPYVMTETPIQRLPLAFDESLEVFMKNLEQQRGSRPAAEMRTHLENIVDLYEQLYGLLPSWPLMEKLKDLSGTSSPVRVPAHMDYSP